MRASVFCLFFAFLLTNAAEAAHPIPKLKVEVAADYVEVQHATRGGTVLVIGFERSAHEFSRVFRRIERQGTAAGDGSVRLPMPPGHEHVANSFWVAVDLASGDYGAVTGDGRKLREGDLLADALKKDNAGRRKRVVTRFDSVFMLVIRPGAGAWDLTTGDGGPSDEDGQVNGQIDMDVSRLSRRGTGVTDFDEYREGDLVIVFVPRQMGYVLAGVTK